MAKVRKSKCLKNEIDRNGKHVGDRVVKSPMICSHLLFLPTSVFYFGIIVCVVGTLLVADSFWYRAKELRLLDPDVDYDSVPIRNIRDFLETFVCLYQPKNTLFGENNQTVHDDLGISTSETAGYCHPRLEASPLNRTQIISFSENPTNDTLRSSPSLIPLSDSLSKILRILSLTKLWSKDTFPSSTHPKVRDGELIMRLPRPLQIWDLDSLRDEFIQQHFLGLSGRNYIENQTKHATKHIDTQNSLDSGAYLAVHLLRLLQASQVTEVNENAQCSPETMNFDNFNESVSWTNTKQYTKRIKLLSPYLNMLPTYSERMTNAEVSNSHDHPLTWSQSVLESLFPKYTHAYNLILYYQQMIKSEYDSLRAMSPNEFGNNVNFTEYLGMRINVLSRAFGLSLSINDDGPAWKTSSPKQIWEEIKSYETSNFGAFLMNLQVSDNVMFRSMCPLLDMYNSHPHPNVIWRYDSATASFEVHAGKDGIPPGHSIIVSYGKYTESHLFAKYGYVNGDGSSKTEASLAIFHRLIGDVGLSRQFSPLPFNVWDDHSSRSTVLGATERKKEIELQNTEQFSKNLLGIQSKELLRYLMFDDGYDECIRINTTEYSTQQELKLLKFQHLQRLANIPDVWIIRLPPKFPSARPTQDEKALGKKVEDKKRVGINANRILSVCRLLSLTENDINRDSINYLKRGLIFTEARSSSMNPSFFEVEKHSDELEYRAFMCVVRLTNIALNRYESFFRSYGNSKPQTVGSRKWSAWYIREGEMRLYSILQQTAVSEAQKIGRRLEISSMKPLVRSKACPLEYSLPLLGLSVT